jgi:hypothetical protein
MEIMENGSRDETRSIRIRFEGLEHFNGSSSERDCLLVSQYSRDF